MQGSKSDFDRKFFLEQLDFTLDQRHAEERLQRAKEVARAVGATGPAADPPQFSDFSDHEYFDMSSGQQDLLWELQQEEIRRWIDQETDRLFPEGRDAVVGEDCWSIPDSHIEQGGRHIFAFPDGLQPDLEDTTDDWQGRILIDSWARTQQMLRGSIRLREPFWWEVCNGI